jgi:hypothetical protein
VDGTLRGGWRQGLANVLVEEIVWSGKVVTATERPLLKRWKGVAGVLAVPHVTEEREGGLA